MAVRTFKAITVGVINDASVYPYDTSQINIRGIACNSLSGTGTITLTFKDGTSTTTPRIPAGTPYESLYEKEIHSIDSVSGLVTFDIELLRQGVS